MSAVIAVPDLMAQAATDLANIGDTVNAAHLTAAPPTTAVPPAAADEVSASIAHLLSGYGQDYQKLAGQAAASFQEFAQHLTASAGAYAGAEAANVASLQPADSIGSAIEGQLSNLAISTFFSQVGSLRALAQLADSYSFLTPLFQLATLGLIIEVLLFFWALGAVSPLTSFLYYF